MFSLSAMTKKIQKQYKDNSIYLLQYQHNKSIEFNFKLIGTISSSMALLLVIMGFDVGTGFKAAV